VVTNLDAVGLAVHQPSAHVRASQELAEEEGTVDVVTGACPQRSSRPAQDALVRVIGGDVALHEGHDLLRVSVQRARLLGDVVDRTVCGATGVGAGRGGR